MFLYLPALLVHNNHGYCTISHVLLEHCLYEMNVDNLSNKNHGYGLM